MDEHGNTFKLALYHEKDDSLLSNLINLIIPNKNNDGMYI